MKRILILILILIFGCNIAFAEGEPEPPAGPIGTPTDPIYTIMMDPAQSTQNPENLRAINITNDSVTIIWNGAGNYDVFLDGTLYGSTNETKYTITGLSEGQKYNIHVKAADTGSTSNIITVNTLQSIDKIDPEQIILQSWDYVRSLAPYMVIIASICIAGLVFENVKLFIWG